MTLVVALPQGDLITLAEIKEKIAYHLKRVEAVAVEIPSRMSVGLFDVNCVQVRDVLVAKHQAVFEALLELVASLARGRCEGIKKEFDDMCAKVRQQPKNPEHVQEMRQYFEEVEGFTANLRPQIAELPAYYSLLDSFATSLYSVPEIGQTRQQYRLTVQNAAEHNVSSVTPWIALGSGYRRGITNTSLGSNYWDSAWDYGYEYSWILGAEINQPFYAKNPVKFAPWNFAKRAVFYPSVFEQAMTVPVATPHGNSTLIFLHFLAYVRGAAGVPELPQWRPVPPQFGSAH